jgi:hypothetical protein
MDTYPFVRMELDTTDKRSPTGTLEDGARIVLEIGQDVTLFRALSLEAAVERTVQLAERSNPTNRLEARSVRDFIASHTDSLSYTILSRPARPVYVQSAADGTHEGLASSVRVQDLLVPFTDLEGSKKTFDRLYVQLSYTAEQGGERS